MDVPYVRMGAVASLVARSDQWARVAEGIPARINALRSRASQGQGVWQGHWWSVAVRRGVGEQGRDRMWIRHRPDCRGCLSPGSAWLRSGATIAPEVVGGVEVAGCPGMLVCLVWETPPERVSRYTELETQMQGLVDRAKAAPGVWHLLVEGMPARFKNYRSRVRNGRGLWADHAWEVKQLAAGDRTSSLYVRHREDCPCSPDEL
ncbi:hypothetical protein Ssi02_21850 [Sinosporangium siamense]|uniref:Uncharacterized protein n=2 Tax=Sinosporangium siamense TaxID=1367973 RepID=A0A919VBB6_9ACTN|nr:hypothetical protein Ssi02_21850 [Sinosporangium siamense]